MKWDEFIAMAPLLLICVACLVGAVILMAKAVAEDPWVNGIGLAFSFWLVIGGWYLHIKNNATDGS